MSGIDWAALSRLIPEALMVVIVLGYLWQAGKRQDAKDERRDSMFINAMANRDKEWREFMNVERKRQSESTASLAHEIGALASIVSATNSLLVQHDAWERLRLEGYIKTEQKDS